MLTGHSSLVHNDLVDRTLPHCPFSSVILLYRHTTRTIASLPVQLRSHGNGSLTPFKCLLVSVNIENGLRPREDIKCYYHLSQSNGKYLDIMSYQAFSVLASDTNTCYSTWVYPMHVANHAAETEEAWERG